MAVFSATIFVEFNWVVLRRFVHKMVRTCCLKSCKSISTKEKLSFFSIPGIITNQDEATRELSSKRRKLWMKRLSLGPDVVTKNTRVCSKHFFSAKPSALFDKTNPDWAPNKSLNPLSVSSDAFLQKSVARYQRKKRRSALGYITNKIHSTNIGNNSTACIMETEESQASSTFLGHESDTILRSFEETNIEHCTTENTINEDDIVTNELSAIMEQEETQLVENSPKIEDDQSALVSSSPGPLKLFVDGSMQTTIRVYADKEVQTYSEFDLISDSKPNVKESEMQTFLEKVDCETQTYLEKFDGETQTLFRVVEQFELEYVEYELEKSQKLFEGLNEKYEQANEQIRNYISENRKLLGKIDALQSELANSNYSETYFKGNNDKIKYFTGLESMGVVLTVLKRIRPFLFNNSKLDHFQQLILTLMKMRLAVTNLDLAYRFNISDRTVGRLFHNTLNILYKLFQKSIIWPERDILQATMPMCFQVNFGKRVATIIDCFEIFTEKPSNVLSKAETWSSYKHSNTVKYLIAITPQGTISFVSKGWGGRVSDKHLTENCGFLNNLLPGDVVLADRGFNIADSVSMFYASVKLPAFTKGKAQLNPEEIEDTRKIANVRIHVERVIGLLRQKYQILHTKIPIELLHEAPEDETIAIIDKIVVSACGLTNLTSPVIPIE